jgi:phage-related minor tail protein
MAKTGEELTASMRMETSRLRFEMTELTRVSESFGRTIAHAFAGAVTGSRKLSDVLRSLIASFSRQTLSAALRPLGAALTGQLAGLISPLAAGHKITPFAMGGIVHSPSLFAMKGGLGLMGERGAEAVLPLARGPDGRLGVQSDGRGAVNVTVHISTPDLASFQRSRSQVSALLARAVQQGQRDL